ncbi:DoxX family protein [Tenacibaculum aiptasiae]|uniref:DoxX family protein n=1 Tax=Tenacibaculum aiptasiae TaxID=426481 RepID=UPI003B5C57C2
MKNKYLKLFLRLSIAFGFLSAVADRFGLYSKEISTWGNWNSFIDFTHLITPWFPKIIIPSIAIIATILEIVFAICLLLGYKTQLTAKLSGVLLLIFGLSMTFSLGIKPPLDYSVFGISAAAFALSNFNEPYLEIDTLIPNKNDA